jgi:hypothetical protein
MSDREHRPRAPLTIAMVRDVLARAKATPPEEWPLIHDWQFPVEREPALNFYWVDEAGAVSEWSFQTLPPIRRTPR